MTTRRYRPHTLDLADGGRLVIRANGTIERFDADGGPSASWSPDDPEWAQWALRFGLRPERATVTPRRDRRPPPA